jgi:tetratricopeptide (TPR) repeat protein
MRTEFHEEIRRKIADAGGTSPALLKEIDRELTQRPSASLWVLRGDALQLSDGGATALDEAERSYREALDLDPNFGEAYEALGHFVFAVRDDAAASSAYFRRALELGAGQSALEGLDESEAEVREGLESGLRAPGRLTTGVKS